MNFWQKKSPFEKKAGDTILNFVAANGYVSLVKLYLGARWVKSDCSGWTALHYAAAYSHLDCVGPLLSTKRVKNGDRKLAYELGSAETKRLIDNHSRKEMAVQSIFPLTLLSI